MISPSAEEQAILDVIQRWARASERGDYAALEPLMHPDVVFFTAGNEPVGRDAFRDSFLNIVKTMHLQSNVETREIEVVGDLAYALNWIQVRIAGTADDVSIERKGNALSIYRRNVAGQWQLWRDANLMARSQE